MIKSTLLTIAAATCAATVCAQTPAIVPDAAPEITVCAKAPAKAQETTNPIIINIKAASGDNISYIFAYRENGGEIETYGVKKSTTGTFDLDLPKGKFNFMAFGTCEKNMGIITLYKDDVDCALGTIVEFNTADADKRTDITYTDATGAPLDLKTVYGAMSYTMSYATYKGAGLVSVPAMSQSSVYMYFRSNSTAPTVDWYRADIYAGEGIGTFATTFKVDFAAATNGPDATGWQTANYDFQPTPANAKMDEFVEMMRGMAPAGEDTTLPMHINYGVVYNGIRIASGMVAAFSNYPDGSDVAFWSDNSPNGLAAQIQPTSDLFFSYGVLGLPVRLVDGKLETYGVNLYMGIETIGTNDTQSYGKGCPFFNRPVEPDAILANCAPAFFAAPYGNYPKYTFFGRYGEDMQIDAFDINEIFDEPEIVQMLGGQTNSIILKKGDELVTDDRSKFPGKVTWDRAAEYTLEVTTKNILIDGSLPGQTTATMTWCPEKSANSQPTVSALTFRDAAGKTTDRFAVNTDGTLSLYCANFKGTFSDQGYGYHFDLEPVTSLKVEYAAAGTDKWAELSPVANPALDYAPGFGNYYACDLAEVSAISETGWYDLRVTVTNGNGCRQTQTIAPAVKIEKIAGVADIAVDATATVIDRFNLQGQRIEHPAAGALVIERLSDGTSRKVIVK